MKLTTAIVRRLELPPGKTDHIKWDEDFPGFGVRLRKGKKGLSRTWIYQYDIAGHTRRRKIGNANAMGIEGAKKIASGLQGVVLSGDDPARQKAEKLERAAFVFANVMKSFLEVKKRTTRQSTYEGTCWLLGDPCKSLYSMSLAAITRRDIASVLTPIAARGTPAEHNNVRGKLVAFFNWTIKQGLIEYNPANGTEKLETKSRERVLSMDELKAISQALVGLTDYATHVRLSMQVGLREYGNTLPWREQTIVAIMTDYCSILHLLMLTGCRRSEISELPWCEIRADKTFIDEGLPVEGPAIVLPPERTKNGRRFIVPLSKPAQTILFSRQRDLDGRLVFPRRMNGQSTSGRAWSTHKKLLDAALAERGHKLEPWHFHDLRRSVATHMGDMGIQPHVVEEVLNHFRRNVYNKSKLEPPKRQAIEAWGEKLMARIEDREPADNITQLRA
jgi:integrase